MNRIPVPIVQSDAPNPDLDAFVAQLKELQKGASWAPIAVSPPHRRVRRQR